MTLIDTPAGIHRWVILSRMHQLALELNTDMRHSRGPILASMYYEGLIDTKLRSTKANKQMVLRALVDLMLEMDLISEVPALVTEALNR